MRDAKNHIISALCTCHPEFPLEAWDLLLPQLEDTFNILRPFGPNPAISAYEGVEGQQYDYLRHPIAPPGTLGLIYETPEQRASWAAHGVTGFYTGPAKQHYRCFNVITAATKHARVAETLAWFPTPYCVPGSSPIAQLHALVTDMAPSLASPAASPPVPGHLAPPSHAQSNPPSNAFQAPFGPP